MNNYYDIEDILTDGQKLPCRFNIDVPGLGYLQGNGVSDLSKDVKLELSLWMAELLALSPISPTQSDESFVSLLRPSFLSPKVLNSIKSDPINLDVRQQNLVFFNLCERWLSIFNDPELADVFTQSLLTRAVAISDVASSRTASSDQSDFLSKLDEFEMKLYKAAHEADKDMRNWIVQTK